MAAGNVSLFFQIAAGLIPVLLLASSINESLRDWFDDLSAGARLAFTLFAVPITAAAVVAEFVAIAEAVSGDLVVSAWRVIFVADVLAIGTMVLACSFVLPWLKKFRVIQSWPGVMTGILVILVGAT